MQSHETPTQPATPPNLLVNLEWYIKDGVGRRRRRQCHLLHRGVSTRATHCRRLGLEWPALALALGFGQLRVCSRLRRRLEQPASMLAGEGGARKGGTRKSIFEMEHAHRCCLACADLELGSSESLSSHLCTCLGRLEGRLPSLGRLLCFACRHHHGECIRRQPCGRTTRSSTSRLGGSEAAAVVADNLRTQLPHGVFDARHGALIDLDRGLLEVTGRVQMAAPKCANGPLGRPRQSSTVRLVDRVNPYRVNDRKEIKLAVLGLEVERLAWIALH